ncbi:MAG: NAD-dependent epimerase/dehydratase family protein, partial [Gammaproteobacteria bacterium]
MNDAPPRRVLVTGANGFVGRALCRALAARGREVLAVTRLPATIAGASRVLAVGDLVRLQDWTPLLEGVEGVAHLAALTHDGTRGASSAHFTAVNVDVSRRLAQAARARGVAHFVYLSSIKAAGERSPPGRALSGDDASAPEDDYGRSKLA